MFLHTGSFADVPKFHHLNTRSTSLSAVWALVEATDEAATGCPIGLWERMHAAYRRAAQLEWMFWDTAYHQEQWSV